MAPEDQKIGNNTIDALLTVLIAVAASNWALVEFVDTNLLTDVVGLSAQNLTAAYGAIAIAAVVVVYNTAVWMGWTDGMGES